MPVPCARVASRSNGLTVTPTTVAVYHNNEFSTFQSYVNVYDKFPATEHAEILAPLPAPTHTLSGNNFLSGLTRPDAPATQQFVSGAYSLNFLDGGLAGSSIGFTVPASGIAPITSGRITSESRTSLQNLDWTSGISPVIHLTEVPAPGISMHLHVSPRLRFGEVYIPGQSYSFAAGSSSLTIPIDALRGMTEVSVTLLGVRTFDLDVNNSPMPIEFARGEYLLWSRLGDFAVVPVPNGVAVATLAIVCLSRRNR